MPGVTIEVLNYDDRLLMINRTGKTVAITGYEREPYARLREDGTVEVNRRSPTHYLNEERYGGTPVPTSADPKAPPQWETVSRTGRFEWHDHRIHWMSKDTVPPQVKDEDKRTKVFDWRVPIRVGSQPAALTGDALLAAGYGIRSADRGNRRPRRARDRDLGAVFDRASTASRRGAAPAGLVAGLPLADGHAVPRAVGVRHRVPRGDQQPRRETASLSSQRAPGLVQT